MNQRDSVAAPGPAAFLNGNFIAAADCKLAIYDTGIVMGAAVTDFARTFHGELFRLEDHVRRLHRSAHYARLTMPHTETETTELARRLVAHNHALAPDPELGLVFYLTAGENALYAGAAGLPATMQPTFVMHTFPQPFHLWRDIFRSGAHCVTPPTRHWPPESLSSKIKHRNRLHMWIGEREAKLADPAAIALYLDGAGNITETGGSNFVIYRDGVVISPRRANILWGVSLTVMTEILAELGVPFREDDIQIYDAQTADEAWVPTTPYCLGPVVKLNGVPIGTGAPGPLWRRVIDRWSQLVGKDIYREIAEAP